MKTYQLLGYAGLIPFIIFLWLIIYPPIMFTINAVQAFTLYSIVIFSFIAGSLWRKEPLIENKKPQIISNILCLYAFGCFFLPINISLVCLCIGYIILFTSEYYLSTPKENSNTDDYLSMRLRLTIIVTSAHIAALVAH